VYESIVKGEHAIEAGMPESFNVLVKEIRSLGYRYRVGTLLRHAVIRPSHKPTAAPYRELKRHFHSMELIHERLAGPVQAVHAGRTFRRDQYRACIAREDPLVVVMAR